MMKQLLILSAFLFLFISCNEKEKSPVNSGEFTLSSESFGTSTYYRYGYSFEEGDFVRFQGISQEELPDIFLLDTPKPPENNLIAFISTETGNTNGIMKTGDFESLPEAENFYNSYILAVDGPWSVESDTLENYQVYLMKTSKDHFVKFLVKDIREISNSSSTSFMEVDISYFIQRNGSADLTGK